MVPRHIRFDQVCLRTVLELGKSDYSKQATKRQKAEDGAARTVRPKEDVQADKAELFSSVIDLRAAKLRQRERFDWAFTTDGVCARLQCRKAPKGTAGTPTRGIHAIDSLRGRDLHVVGIDPGKVELVHAVDMDDPTRTAVRYTQQQRIRETRREQYAAASRNSRGPCVKQAETRLAESDVSSRASSLAGFAAYVDLRRVGMEACLQYYSRIGHRKRRWKAYIKEQKSEERLYDRLGAIDKDDRQLVLAYGSWGAVAGRVGVANTGNPPCIGVGLMRKLSKRFLVAITPEHHTSSTCCKCGFKCGPWEQLEEKMGRKIRGVRVCQNEDCGLPQNRDRTGAANIGVQFGRLMRGEGPIRPMSAEEEKFHDLNVQCAVCE